MSKLRIALVFIFACMLPLGVYAQGRFVGPDEFYKHDKPEDGNRTEDGKIVRGAYLTNDWYDNWVFGIAGGIHSVYSPVEGAQMRISPNVEMTVTKWVTPSVGARFGFQGLGFSEKFPARWLGAHYVLARDPNDYELIRYKETYFHADILLDISSLIWGYRETRDVNVIPYIHGGYMRIGHPDYSYFNTQYRDREAAIGFGAIAKYRISNHVHATLDLRYVNFSGRYHDSAGGRVSDFQASAGLTYTIFKWYWSRYSTVVAPLKNKYNDTKALLAEAEKNRDRLQKEKDRLADLNLSLSQNIKDLENLLKNYKEEAKKNPKDELLQRVANAEAVFFYEINVDQLDEIESIRLDQYVLESITANPGKVFYITGSADKGTGTEAINARLSRARAENIRKILNKKYNIPLSQIVIKATIISDKHADGRLDRCVLFESQ